MQQRIALTVTGQTPEIPMVRQTLGASVCRSGVGIHSGAPARVTLRPAPFGSGLVLQTPTSSVPVSWAEATAVPGATRIGSILTPEHLLAALAALGVTDAIVAVSGPEIPALDGCSEGWVAAIDQAGREGGPDLVRRALPRVEVAAAGGTASAGPGPDRIGVEVDFGGAGPAGRLDLARDEATFRTEVAWARTFVLSHQIEALRAAGRGRGAGLDNTVVWPTGPLRSDDEPVRHKLLDAWGDLALLGPVRGWVRVVRGSHALHHALLRRIVRAWGIG